MKLSIINMLIKLKETARKHVDETEPKMKKGGRGILRFKYVEKK